MVASFKATLAVDLVSVLGDRIELVFLDRDGESD